MAFQPAPSIAGAVIKGRMDNQLVELTSSWFASGAITPSSLNLLAGGISGWVIAELAPLLSRDVTFQSVSTVDLGSATGAITEVSALATGGVDVEAAPNNVAACVSLRSDQRGRSGHGRNFVPGIPNSVITLNTLDQTFIDDLLTAYNNLVGAGSFVAGWQLVVLSRVNGGVPLANGVGIPISFATMIGNSVRSMRSREIGHGA